MENNITKFLLDQKFTAKDLSVTSRQLNYWKTKDVVPFLKKNRMTILNLPQALYLTLIAELSNIGIATEKLEKLSTCVWINSKFSTYPHEKFEDMVDFCIKHNTDFMFLFCPDDNKFVFQRIEQLNVYDFFKTKETLIMIPNLISFLSHKLTYNK